MGQPGSWVTTGKGDRRPNGWRLGREQQRGKQIFPAEHPEDEEPTVGFDFPCVPNSIDWAHPITLWWKCLHVSEDRELLAHLLESIQPHLFRFIKVWQNKMSQCNLWFRLSQTSGKSIQVFMNAIWMGGTHTPGTHITSITHTLVAVVSSRIQSMSSSERNPWIVFILHKRRERKGQLRNRPRKSCWLATFWIGTLFFYTSCNFQVAGV